MRVDTDSLRWFQQVADGVTVTEVSEIERVTQSGVSRALGRLEREVGTALLRRSGRTLRMTHAGTVFKRHVDVLLHELDDGVAAVNELLDPDSGTVSLAFQVSLGTWLVPELISSFRRAHPDVRFQLSQVRDELTSPVLDDTRADLEITTHRPANSSVEWRALLAQPLVLAVPREHPLTAGAGVGLAAAADERFVMLRPTSLLRRQCEELCRAAGFAPQVAFEADDLPTVHGLVGAGLGVAVVPAGAPLAADGAVAVVPITDAHAAREVGLAWASGRRMLPAANLFRKHVLRSVPQG